MIPVQIPARKRKCCLCAEEFLAGSCYHSILIEEDTISRNDFCHSCWEKEGKNRSPICSHWKGHLPKEKEDTSVQNEEKSRLDEFRISVQSTEEKEQMKAFLLALYLNRRKVVLPRGELTLQENQTLLYELAETGETFSVMQFPSEKAKLWQDETNSE